MKVALVTSIARGGPLEHALLLARDLARAGVDVRAVALDEPAAARFAAAGAQAAVIPLARPFDPAGAVRVRRFVRGADVVHTHDRRSGLWVRALPRRGELRVHTLHGLPEPFLTDAPPGLKARVAYRGLERGLERMTDVLVTPSHAMARLLAERVGYAQERLVVIPNGVDVPDRPLDRGELVGTISLLEPVKGLEHFVDAARIVVARRPQTRFAIFGTGSLEAALKARAAALPVEFPGFVRAHDALPRLSVFALPSLMENSPLALLEALAAGIPAVASRVGGVPEYAPDGTATLVPPADPGALASALLELLDDPALAARRVDAGRAAAAEHSAARTAERMLALYVSAASRAGRAAP
ncbi:MAG TPA: glycosyltransferase family 4 protein [Solirubrobacter sp.]|nr:glycosyltransferase family 4 protein [Solirubrobacter sp.]